MMTKKTATFIKKCGGFNGNVNLYLLSPPVQYNGWGEAHKDAALSSEYVVVSALEAAFDTGAPETYIFPANSDGEVLDWSELDGSYRGGTDHDQALRDMGYEPVYDTIEGELT